MKDGNLMRMVTGTYIAAAAVICIGVFSLAHAPLVHGKKPLQLFVTSDQCMACHNLLVTGSGDNISIGKSWQAAMMAHSARDPYWQASMRREVTDHPESQKEIEDECSTCHMPMSRFTARARGHEGEVFSHLPVYLAETEADRLAVDGVSCTVCHQIKADKLGTRESFAGGFAIDTERPLDERTVHGPYEVDDGRKSLMRSATGFIPEQKKHIQDSALCGSCHTLYTKTRNEKGEVTGHFPEQMPFLEWRHSMYKDAMSCQSCHMPEYPEKTHISSVAAQDRSGVSRHVFRGGNFFMLRMLNRFRHFLGVVSLPRELERSHKITTDHLKEESASISIGESSFSGDRLRFRVTVTNNAGHKLPTAYPSRRAWIQVTVYDNAGNVAFESGKLNKDGSVAGNDNDDDPRKYEPHYTAITEPGQVQVYESIFVTADDTVSTGLLSAARYIKDNRILPVGFDKKTAQEDIAVQGRAFEDNDFTGSSDSVQYSVKVRARGGPYMVQVKLWYQPISFRWARNLKSYDYEETNRFTSYYEAMSRETGIVLAETQTRIK